MITQAFRLLVWDVQSPINLGMILRVAEGFAIPVDVWDPRGVLLDKSRARTVSDFACGALERPNTRILASEPTPGRQAGRFIATALDEVDPVSLPDFEFRETDLVAVGNEYDGLPKAVIAKADIVVHIPMPLVRTPKPRSATPLDPTRVGFESKDDKPVLNTAMSAGILCFEATRRAHAKGDW